MELSGLILLGVGGGLIGFLLSVLGAGGSILLLPLLVSGAALPTREAVPLSLLVVMLLALANLGPYIRRGQFAPRPALILGLPALLGSWLGGSWVKAGLIPESVQLAVFSVAALVASWLLTRGGHRDADGANERPLLLALQGVLVGLLTGIAGVGGGFAIVPALVLLAGLPMQLASGTSLLLIAVNALVALGALGYWPAQSLPLMLPLLLGGAVGAVVGQQLAPHLSDRRLRQGFSVLLIGSALLSGLEAWKRQPSPSAQRAPSHPARLIARTSPHRSDEPTHVPFPAAQQPPPARAQHQRSGGGVPQRFRPVGTPAAQPHHAGLPDLSDLATAVPALLSGGQRPREGDRHHAGADEALPDLAQPAGSCEQDHQPARVQQLNSTTSRIHRECPCKLSGGRHA